MGVGERIGEEAVEREDSGGGCGRGKIGGRAMGKRIGLRVRRKDTGEGDDKGEES